MKGGFSEGAPGQGAVCALARLELCTDGPLTVLQLFS